MFHTFDADGSGLLDKDEFLVILQVMDPSLEMSDVELTFGRIGATEALDQEMFWLWCESVFGSLSNNQYVEQLQELISISLPTIPNLS